MNKEGKRWLRSWQDFRSDTHDPIRSKQNLPFYVDFIREKNCETEKKNPNKKFQH